MKKVKVLFLAANPIGTSKLALDEEMRSVDNKIYASKPHGQIELSAVWAARSDDLLQVLNQYRSQIVHFEGYSTSVKELQLVGNDGFPRTVSSKALAAIFKTLKDNIHLVVLNGCYSKQQAEAIVQEVECVVGINATIGDNAAKTFLGSFYRAVAFDRSIQEAFEQGKTALLLEGITEEQMPKLLVRSGSDPSRIFLLRPDFLKTSTLQNTSQPTDVGLKTPSVSTPEQDINLFLSYAHEDKALRDELAKHLILLKRQGIIINWYDQEIHPGENLQEQIWTQLEATQNIDTAHIILLLISPDYIASDGLINEQIERALTRHQAGEARVLPIILRYTDGWEQTGLGEVLALPREKKPLTAWDNRDDAFSSIAQDIRNIIKGTLGLKADNS